MKRWIITGMSLGAGLAITLGIMFGAFIWYENKPKPPKPWNKEALTAKFDFIDTESDNTLAFYYTLENNTDFDYQITESSLVSIMAKLEEQNSLTGPVANNYLTIDTPLLLPAKQRMRFCIHLNYHCNKKIKNNATKEERKIYHKEIASFVNKELSNLNGFVIFDQINRYQINFPKEW